MIHVQADPIAENRSPLPRKSTAKKRYGSRFSVFGSVFWNFFFIFANRTNQTKNAMIKKTLILIFLVAWSIGNLAQTTTQRLVVWQKSGEKVYFDISELPETTFEDGQLVITTSKATVYYQLENVLRYTYEGIKSGIDLMAGERSVSISRKADAVTFHNLPQGTVVSLYSANGVLIKQQTADGQPLTLSVKNHPSGVYLVKAGKETIKLMKP